MSMIPPTESYLTFNLDNELFGINVSKVLEILEVKPITKVPKSPSFMRGVINLRGNILPVIDTRNKFCMAQQAFTIDTCIIVLNINTGKDSLLVGALVDSVQKVIDIAAESIQHSQSMGAIYREDFIYGIGKVAEDFIMILDVDKVFSAEELSVLEADN
ncbi:MAG: chemotaxis protein CheW [Ferruginibacter sp.]